MRTASAALCAAGVVFWATAPPPADARSPVAIEGVDKTQREAILDLLPDRDRPTTLFEAERISEEAAARALAWLRSEGYYAAEVTPEAQEDPPLARLRIAPGQRFRFVAPDVVFDGAAPNDLAAYEARAIIARISPGAPARAADVLQTEADAVAALQAAGYADAAAGERRVVVDHATMTMKAEFHLNAGGLARLGDVRVEPANVFRREFLVHLRNWRPGATYKPDNLTRLRRDLSSTGAVSSVTTHLDPPNAQGERDVVIQIEPAKRNSYEFGAGYSTTEGASVDAQWTQRNFTGRADALTLSTTLGELAQSATVSWVRPHASGAGRTRHTSLTVLHEDTAAYSHRGIALSSGVDADRKLRLGFSYGAELSADNYNQTAGGVTNAYVLSGFGDLRRDTTGEPLDARHGSILDFRLEPSVSVGDATVAFTRFIGEGRLYESFAANDRFTIAARTKLGWIVPVSGSADDVPPDHRFYAGGGGSVRGYEYNSIYPHERDALGLSPGGQGVFEVSTEARVRFADRFGAAAFVDGGNAFDQWRDAAELKWGVGVGLRYDLGFAPLRVDVARALDRGPDDPAYAIYISLGQAF
ncbi:MAG: BamA/TamA family outer membrane protein [Pseudomonadota bacterium]